MIKGGSHDQADYCFLWVFPSFSFYIPMFHGEWLFNFAYLMAFNHVIVQALLFFFHCQNKHFKWMLKSRVKTCKISVRFDNDDFSKDSWSIFTSLLVFSWLIRYNFFEFRQTNWYKVEHFCLLTIYCPAMGNLWFRQICIFWYCLPAILKWVTVKRL